MRAVITVVGHDAVGIIARVADVLSKSRINILDISQSVLSDFFAMVMLTDISNSTIDFPELSARLSALGDEMGLKIIAMHEDVFNSMHRI